MTQNLQELLTKVILISEKASQAVLPIYHSPKVSFQEKSDHSPLTEADLLADKIIREELGVFNIPVLTEETRIPEEERKKASKLWLIDPIDGTRDFLAKNDEFTINIGLVENGEPLLGVVAVPAWGVTYYAARGLGAFMKDKEGVHQIKNNGPTQHLKCTESRFHAVEETKAFCEHYGIKEIITFGSSIKLCKLAEGVVDVVPRFGGCYDWDVAAPHCIIREAGCKLISLETDKELRYDRDSIRVPQYIATHCDLSLTWKR